MSADEKVNTEKGVPVAKVIYSIAHQHKYINSLRHQVLSLKIANFQPELNWLNIVTDLILNKILS